MLRGAVPVPLPRPGLTTLPEAAIGACRHGPGWEPQCLICRTAQTFWFRGALREIESRAEGTAGAEEVRYLAEHAAAGESFFRAALDAPRYRRTLHAAIRKLEPLVLLPGGRPALLEACRELCGQARKSQGQPSFLRADKREWIPVECPADAAPVPIHPDLEDVSQLYRDAAGRAELLERELMDASPAVPAAAYGALSHYARWSRRASIIYLDALLLELGEAFELPRRRLELRVLLDDLPVPHPTDPEGVAFVGLVRDSLTCALAEVEALLERRAASRPTPLRHRGGGDAVGAGADVGRRAAGGGHG